MQAKELTSLEGHGNLIERLQNLGQIGRLIETNARQADEKDLCVAIDNMKLLHHLFLKAANEEEPLRMDALSSPPCLDRVSRVVPVFMG